MCVGMMEDNACQSLGRIYTFLVIVVLTLLSLFATLLHREERHAHVDLRQRNVRLYPRQQVSSTPFAAPNSSSVSVSIAGITLASTTTGSSSQTTMTTAVSSPQFSGTNSSSSTGMSSSSTLSSSGLSNQTSTSFSTTSTSAVSSSSAASSTSEQYSTTSIAAMNPSDYTGADHTSTSTGMPPTSSSNSATSTSTSSKSRFWNNKGAVAITFLFVSLFVIAVVAFLAFRMYKSRRNRRVALEDADFMTTLRDSKTGSLSPSLSLNDSPMDPFARREVVYHNVPIGTLDPPTQSTRPVPTPHHSSPSKHSEPKRYVPPSQLSSTPAAVQRDVSEVRSSTLSGYQPSFDSFYGVYSSTSSPTR